jgi:hypothetical protein
VAFNSSLSILRIDCVDGQIFTMVRHLEYWGLVDVITTISEASIFRGSFLPDSESRCRAEMAFGNFITAYHSSNPSSSPYLATVLIAFNGSRRLSEVVPFLPSQWRPFLIDIVIWLLRWRLLDEVHQYYLWAECPFEYRHAAIAAATIGSREISRMASISHVQQPSAGAQKCGGSNSSSRRGSSFGSDCSGDGSTNWLSDEQSNRPSLHQCRGDVASLSASSAADVSLIQRAHHMLDGRHNSYELCWTLKISAEHWDEVVRRYPQILVINY